MANKWKLFIDSGKVNLEAVLSDNGNEKPSVSLGHVDGMEETRESIELILKRGNHLFHKWNIYLGHISRKNSKGHRIRNMKHLIDFEHFCMLLFTRGNSFYFKRCNVSLNHTKVRWKLLQ